MKKDGVDTYSGLHNQTNRVSLKIPSSGNITVEVLDI